MSERLERKKQQQVLVIETLEKTLVFHVGMLIEIKHGKEWWSASVKAIESGKLKVAYPGFDSSFDQWIDAESKRIRFTEIQPEKSSIVQYAVGCDETPPQKPPMNSYAPLTPKSTIKKPQILKLAHSPDELPKQEALFDITLLSHRGTRNTIKKLSKITEGVALGGLQVGTKICVEDAGKTPWPAIVIKVDGCMRLVHYEGWDSKFDEWIDVESKRIRDIGTVEEIANATEVEVVQKGRNTKLKGLPKKKPKYNIINCCKCDGGYEDDGDQLVLCHVCDAAYHQKCHNPPISDDVLCGTKKWSCSKHQADVTVVKKSDVSRRSLRTLLSSSNLTSKETISVYNSLIDDFPLGSKVEVADNGNTYWPGEIIAVDGSKRQIRYKGWDPKFDEWIDVESRRLRVFEGVVEEQDDVEVVGRSCKIHKPRKRKLFPEALDPESLYCQICNGGDQVYGNDLVICDSCDQAYHQKCVPENIAQVYVTDINAKWYCPKPDCNALSLVNTTIDPDSISCLICTKDHEVDGDLLVLCDGCNYSYHQKCHDPPIEQDHLLKLSSKWYCSKDKCQKIGFHSSITISCGVCNSIDDHEKCYDPHIPDSIALHPTKKWCCYKYTCLKKGRYVQNYLIIPKKKPNSNLKGDDKHISTGAFITRRVLEELTGAPKKKHLREDEAEVKFTTTQSSFDKEAILTCLPIGTRVTVADMKKVPWPGVVVDAYGSKRKIHYDGFDDKYDETLDWESRRIVVLAEDHPLYHPLEEPIKVQIIERKKKPTNKIAYDKMYCVVCNGGIQSDGNLLVLCDGDCRKTYHQRCHKPEIDESVILNSDEPWFCYLPQCQKLAPKKYKTQIQGHVNTFMDRKILQALSKTNDNEDNLLMDSIASSHGFALNKPIEVSDADGSFWPATMLEFKNGRILVGYDGWSDKYNEWIDSDSRRIRERQELTNRRFILTEDDVEVIAHKKRKIAAKYDIESTKPKGDIDESLLKYKCKNCDQKIKHSVYFCIYCQDRGVAFDLCLLCYQCKFPGHQHPRSSFARKPVMPINSEMARKMCYTMDKFDTTYVHFTNEKERMELASRYTIWEEEIEVLNSFGTQPLPKMLNALPIPKKCAFCNEDSEDVGPFIGPYPFMISANEPGSERSSRKKIFWSHEACAKYSPEVIVTEDGEWYNVLKALQRSRKIRCHMCKEKGATIGCFDPRCKRSYHVPCSGKEISHFEQGILFWCPKHESRLQRIDQYVDVYNCDVCERELSKGDQWYTCNICKKADHFSSFDICTWCFDNEMQIDHEHEKESFVAVNSSLDLLDRKPETSVRKYLKRKKEECIVECVFCWTKTSTVWKKNDNGEVMCLDCFKLGEDAEVLDSSEAIIDSSELADAKYLEMNDNFLHNHYLTRKVVNRDSDGLADEFLVSYEPSKDQLWSLFFDTSFFDIPSRAPRWATHNGADYHGAWLPQIVRWSLKKYTSVGQRVLSNFVGRGTDATECILLERRLCGIDINPGSLCLAQRNSSFVIPKALDISTVYKPVLLIGDARNLSGDLFQDESFDHILSHPPYKDCVQYSALVEGDLSRIHDMMAFQNEMKLVAKESYRVLKPNKRITLGIGDNRRECFYQPVSFQTIRTYMDEGFEIEEIIIKRQRHCTASALGTYLCTMYDFLKFTHEFIIILRKSSKFEYEEPKGDIGFQSIIRRVPMSSIERKSIVMGSIWTFVLNPDYSFPQLITSKIVQRFGKDDQYWEQINIPAFRDHVIQLSEATNFCAERPRSSRVTVKKSIDQYEKNRLIRRDENMSRLIELGLLSELSADGQNDGNYLESLLEMEPTQENPSLVIIPHINIPSTAILSDDGWIKRYRSFIINRAREASLKLPNQGIFAVGIKDFRVKLENEQVTEEILQKLSNLLHPTHLREILESRQKTRYVPLSILVYEDLTKNLDETMKLKEYMVAVPFGYSCDPRLDTEEITIRLEEDYEDWEDECKLEELGISDRRSMLPIVHANYLLFVKNE